MKKAMSLLLISAMIIVVFSSCGDTANQNPKSKDEVENTENSDGKEERADIRTENPANFKSLSYLGKPEITYKKSDFLAQVKPYEIKSDLSDVVNMDKFPTFSAEQKKKLAENGFVVMSPNKEDVMRKMYSRYEVNEYQEIPNFITTDTALNMYHIFFENTLKNLEKDKLSEELLHLSESMRKKAQKAFEKESDAAIKEHLSKITAYFYVAENLLSGDKSEIPEPILNLANQEISLITELSETTKSPLFGYELNYEQFKPRSHYAGDEVLEPYFRAMMWYGLTGFPFKDMNGEIIRENIGSALTITYLTYLEGENDDLASWDKIYEPTNLFVGESDDLSILDMKDFILSVFGENSDYHHYYDDAFSDKIKEEVEKLRKPEVKAELIFVDTPTDLQFRFMGQRYTLDGDIMQDLIAPIERPAPSALDVAAALGNKRAEKYVKKNSLWYMEPEKYDELISKVREKVEKLPEESWYKNLYNAVLWCLKTTWQEKDMKGYPVFMQSDPWKDKMLQTGLGWYVELKHDTLLYSKQPAAEKGGPDLEEPDTPSYVEPNVELYDKLLFLTKYTKEALLKRGLIEEEKEGDAYYDEKRATAIALKNMEEIYTNLLNISIKELKEEPLTKDEILMIAQIGGYFEYIEHLMFKDDYRSDLASSIVADISNIADTGEFLEIGTGFPEDIFVVLSHKGKKYLARGTTYSFYEFLSETALTDNEWLNMLGFDIEKTYEDMPFKFYTLDSKNVNRKTPKQYDWIYNFKSKEPNNVLTEYPEFR